MAKISKAEQNAILAEPRFLLAVKARWFVIGLLVLFGVITSLSNPDYYAISDALKYLAYPAIALIIALIYNFALHYSWYAFPQLWSQNLKTISGAQIILDILIATVIIHFTGGVSSWFWTLYVLITLELTFLLPNIKDILVIGLIGSASYTLLLVAEYYGLIRVGKMTYMSTDLTRSLAYIAIIWIWVHLLSITVALVSLDFQRKRISEMEARMTKDELTGVYNMSYFNQALANEIQRSKRYQRPISLVLIDIDNFAKYKADESEGDANELIIRLANILGGNIRRHRGDSSYDVDILCRFGHDQFAVILPETTAETVSGPKETKPAGGVVLAKRLMGKIAEGITAETGITVSMGVAGFPYHAIDTESLVQAVQDATKKAKNLGKHRIMVATPLATTHKVPVH